MKKVTSRENCPVLVEDAVILTGSELEKVSNPQLKKYITEWCKDHMCQWRSEQMGNVTMSILSRSMEYADDNRFHEMEMIHTNLISFIDNLELPTQDEKVLDDEDPHAASSDDAKEELKFVKDLLKEFDDEPRAVGAAILADCGRFVSPCGNIGGDTLKRMLEAYVKVHDHE